MCRSLVCVRARPTDASRLAFSRQTVPLHSHLLLVRVLFSLTFSLSLSRPGLTFPLYTGERSLPLFLSLSFSLCMCVYV